MASTRRLAAILAADVAGYSRLMRADEEGTHERVEANGICISQVVYEQVRDKLPYPFEDLGLRSVKNIERPLHTFALGADAIAAMPVPEILLAVEAVVPLPVANPMAPRLSIVVLP